MTTPATTEKDPIRKKIHAAMDRLLTGKPLRSTGRLSVSQLAVEAGVARWRLTHEHLDLKELFQARVKAAENAAATTEPSDYDKLKAKHLELLAHCAELENRVQLYANVIDLLVLEKQAAEDSAPVTGLEAARRRRKHTRVMGPC